MKTPITQRGITYLFSILFLSLNLLPVSTTNAQQDNDQLLKLLVQKKLIRPGEADSLRIPAATEEPANIKFKRGGKVWGLAYVDAIYKAHADSAKRGNLQYSAQAKDSAGLDFRRIYLGYDYAISERFSTQLILSNESGGDVVSDGNRSVFIKAASLRWANIFSLSDLTIGIQQTPTFVFTGDRDGVVWEYRSVERSIADQRKLSPSTDAGVQLSGKLNTAGTVGYNLMVGDGSGTKPENTRFQRFYGDVYAKFFNKHLVLDLYADYDRSRLTPFHQSVSTVKVLLAYQSKRFTLGAEAVQQNQQNASFYTEAKIGNPEVIGIRKDTADALVLGLSGFVQVKLIKDWLGAFARYDYFNPDLNFASKNFYTSAYTGNTVQHFITAGLDFSPEKNVHIIPNVWYNDYTSSSDGSVNVHPSSLALHDYDFVYRITLYYTFNR